MNLHKRHNDLNSVEAYILRYPVCANCECTGGGCRCTCDPYESYVQASTYIASGETAGFDTGTAYLGQYGR